MISPAIKKAFAKFKWRGIKGIAADQDGVSAIEFALIAPLMVTLYFGGIELSLLMQADRRVTTVAATVGDLASRETTLTNSDVNDIFLASRLLLSPLDSDVANIVLTSLVSDADGNVTVDWSDGCNATPRSQGTTVENLPSGIIPANGSVIFAEVDYKFASVIGFTFQQRNLSDKFFLRPRRSNTVVRDRSGNGGNNGTSPCSGQLSGESNSSS